VEGEGASPEFVSKAVAAFDELNDELHATGVTAGEVAEKVAVLEQRLVAAAQAEKRQIDQRRAEARIESEVMAKGAYNPREEVARLREVEGGVNRVAAAKVNLRNRTGEAAMQMAYFADDVQYGIRGIMNNIPGLLMSLGAGAGLAGVISIAAVAANFLWQKFGGAKDAAAETEAVKKRVDEMKGAIDAAGARADELYKKDTTEYLAAIDAASTAWERQRAAIESALAATNALAEAQQQLAEAEIEVERQRALGSAGSKEEAEAINAGADLRLATLKRVSQEEAMQRAKDAQETAVNTVRRRREELEGAAGDLRENIGADDAEIAAIMARVGGQSDQARRQQAGQQAEVEIGGTERQLREVQERMAERESGGLNTVARVAAQSADNKRLEELQRKLTEAYKQRDAAAMTRDDDAAAMASGNVEFTKAKEDLEKSDPIAFGSLTQTEQQLRRVRSRRDAERAKLEDVEKNKLPAVIDAEKEQGAKAEVLGIQQDAARARMQADEQKRLNEAARNGGLNNNGLPSYIPAPLPGMAAGPVQPGASGALPPSVLTAPLESVAEATQAAADANDKGNEAAARFAEAAAEEMERLRKSNEELAAKYKELEAKLKNSRS